MTVLLHSRPPSPSGSGRWSVTAMCPVSVAAVSGRGALRYVVCNEAGQPYHPDTLSKMWANTVTAAGVPRIRPHDARHTCGTTMHLQGVPAAVIAAWLGHADVAFTMRTYVHSQPNALADGARSLARVVTIRDNVAGA